MHNTYQCGQRITCLMQWILIYLGLIPITVETSTGFQWLSNKMSECSSTKIDFFECTLRSWIYSWGGWPEIIDIHRPKVPTIHSRQLLHFSPSGNKEMKYSGYVDIFATVLIIWEDLNSVFPNLRFLEMDQPHVCSMMESGSVLSSISMAKGSNCLCFDLQFENVAIRYDKRNLNWILGLVFIAQVSCLKKYVHVETAFRDEVSSMINSRSQLKRISGFVCHRDRQFFFNLQRKFHFHYHGSRDGACVGENGGLKLSISKTMIFVTKWSAHWWEMYGHRSLEEVLLMKGTYVRAKDLWV